MEAELIAMWRRRGGGRFGSHGFGSEPEPTYTLDTFTTDDSNHFARTNTTTTDGSATMCAGVVFYLHTDFTGAAAGTILGQRVGGSGRGYEFEYTSAGLMQARYYNSLGQAVPTVAPVVGPDDIGKFHTMCFSVSSSAFRFWFNGVEYGTPVTTGTYTAPLTTSAFRFGGANGLTRPFLAGEVVGGVVKDNAGLASGEAEAWHAAVLAAGDVVPWPTTATSAWWKSSNNVPTPGNWLDQVASYSITEVGTVTTQQRTAEWGSGT